ncbi:MAG TPA: hypothetical protein VGE13_00125 [Candidatus Saccharimonadales bacterium]
MKSDHDFPQMNAVEYRGDVVPWTDIDQEAGAEWITPEQNDVPASELGSSAVRSAILTDLFPEKDSADIDKSDTSMPEWQRDRLTYAHLGIGTFTMEEFQTLSAHERDVWQRVVRNYVKSLKNHAGRIRNAEGRIEFDHSLASLYGVDRTAEELLQYADNIERAIDVIEASNLINHQIDQSLTARKLKNAPHYETVYIVRDDQKLRLRIATSEKRTA